MNEQINETLNRMDEIRTIYFSKKQKFNFEDFSESFIFFNKKNIFLEFSFFNYKKVMKILFLLES